MARSNKSGGNVKTSFGKKKSHIGGKKSKRLKGPVPDSYMCPIKGHLRSPDIALLAELELIWLNSAEAQVCVCPDSHI